MKIKFLTCCLALLFLHNQGVAQANDSSRVVQTLQQFLTICKSIDPVNDGAKSAKHLKNAAGYIIYRGNDNKRNWKDYANANDAKEKAQVERICSRVNNSINRDSNYKITKYTTEKESEGVWHIVYATYMQEGIQKEIIFAFLKVNNRFGIGDID